MKDLIENHFLKLNFPQSDLNDSKYVDKDDTCLEDINPFDLENTQVLSFGKHSLRRKTSLLDIVIKES